jgi:hypothetical protein
MQMMELFDQGDASKECSTQMMSVVIKSEKQLRNRKSHSRPWTRLLGKWDSIPPV